MVQLQEAGSAGAAKEDNREIRIRDDGDGGEESDESEEGSSSDAEDGEGTDDDDSSSDDGEDESSEDDDSDDSDGSDDSDDSDGSDGSEESGESGEAPPAKSGLQLRTSEHIKKDLGNTVFVRNVLFETTEDTLRKAFSKFGKIRSAKIVVDPHTQRPRGTAFVSFFSTEDAQKAMEAGQHGDRLHESKAISGTAPASRAKATCGWKNMLKKHISVPNTC